MNRMLFPDFTAVAFRVIHAKRAIVGVCNCTTENDSLVTVICAKVLGIAVTIKGPFILFLTGVQADS
jgi:hypothetical protein